MEASVPLVTQAPPIQPIQIRPGVITQVGRRTQDGLGSTELPPTRSDGLVWLPPPVNVSSPSIIAALFTKSHSGRIFTVFYEFVQYYFMLFSLTVFILFCH